LDAGEKRETRLVMIARKGLDRAVTRSVLAPMGF
jgi:hypothetical protein